MGARAQFAVDWLPILGPIQPLMSLCLNVATCIMLPAYLMRSFFRWAHPTKGLLLYFMLVSRRGFSIRSRPAAFTLGGECTSKYCLRIYFSA